MPVKVKLGLSILSDAQFVDKVNAIVTAMTGNANFTTPVPPLAGFTTRATAIQTLLNERASLLAQAQAKTASIVTLRNSTTDELNQLADYVADTANADGTPENPAEAIVESSTMSVAGSGGPVGPMPKIEALSATAGDDDGEIDLQWGSIRRGLRSYNIEMTTAADALTGWTSAGISTKSKFTVSGLTSGTRYWFRVAAIGSAGQGPWSDPAVRTAP